MAKVVEREKLKAIGQRNRIKGEVENRCQQEVNIKNLIIEKQKKLERYEAQLESLKKVEAFQRDGIEKLLYS